MTLPIFYINLHERRDRREFMEQQFSELNLDARRVEAVSAAKLSPEDVERSCNPASVHCLSRSQLACSKSHALAWTSLIASGAAWGLILEDDAIISPHLPGFIESFLASDAADDFDLVQLETMARSTRLLPPVTTIGGSFSLRPFRSTIWCTAGYLISAKTARALLDRQDLFHQPLDGLLFRPYAAPGSTFRMVLAFPALCMQMRFSEASALALGNVAPIRPKAPFRTRLARLAAHLRLFALDAVDHLRHMPLGMTREIVPFGSPDDKYVGSKLGRYGVEVTDVPIK